MSDIRMTYQNDQQRADIDLESLLGTNITVDVQTGYDLSTACMISLMTDRVAVSDWTLTVDQRGWWADAYREQPIGSRIWQLELMSVDDPNEYLIRTKAYCEEALQWLVDAAIAQSVSAHAYFTDTTKRNIGADITVTKSNGLTEQFSYVWDQSL